MTPDQQKAVDEAESFGALDSGIYEAALESCDDTDDSGNVLKGPKGPFWLWTWADLMNVQTGDRAPGKQFYRTSLNFAYKVREVYDALGLDYDEDGSKGMGTKVLLVIEKAPIKSGAKEGQISNNILQVLPHDADLSESGIPNPHLSSAPTDTF